MDLEKILELLTVASKKNIVVYDYSADSGQPTSRLIELIKNCARENNIIFDSMLIDSTFFEDFKYSGISEPLHHLTPWHFDDIRYHFCQYSLHKDAENPVTTHYTKVLSGCLACSDFHMMILFNSRDKQPENVFLASY